MAPDELSRLDALLTTGLGLARKAPSGQLLLARIADSIDLGWIPRPWGERDRKRARGSPGCSRASRSTLAPSSGSFATPGKPARRTSSTTWSPTRSP